MMDFARMSDAFSRIYAGNIWGFGSGVGSMRENAAPYAALLVSFMRANRIRSVVDVGCGDWQFSQHLDWSGVDYLGLDVVPAVVAANAAAFGGPTRRFAVARSLDDLPPADLVICKDVLQHLPIDDIHAYLDVFHRRYRHALVTNDVEPEAGTNGAIAPGECRSIRLDLPPFSLTSACLLRWDMRHGDAAWVKETHLLAGGSQLAAAIASVKAAHAERDASRSEAADARAAALAQAARADRLAEEVAALRNSTSWRLTAPVRRLAGLIRP